MIATETRRHRGDFLENEPFYALYFHNHRLLDQQVNPVFSDGPAFVSHRHGHLASVGQALQFALDAQRFLIDVFQQAGPQVPVHFDGATYDLFCYLI